MGKFKPYSFFISLALVMLLFSRSLYPVSAMETDDNGADYAVDSSDLSSDSGDEDDFAATDDEDLENYEEQANTIQCLSEKEFDEEVIIRVSVPCNLDFYVDPYNFSGNGHIFSPEYSIINYSNVDVELNILDLAYHFSGNGSFFASTEPLDTTISRDAKGVFMFLRQITEASERINDFIITDNAENAVFTLILSAAEYDEEGEFVELNEGSSFYFTIMGDVSIGNSAPWLSGDVWIEMLYSWDAIVPEEEIDEEEFDENELDEEELNGEDTDGDSIDKDGLDGNDFIEDNELDDGEIDDGSSDDDLDIPNEDDVLKPDELDLSEADSELH